MQCALTKKRRLHVPEYEEEYAPQFDIRRTALRLSSSKEGGKRVTMLTHIKGILSFARGPVLGIVLAVGMLVVVTTAHSTPQRNTGNAQQIKASRVMLVGYDGPDAAKAKQFDARTTQSFKLASASFVGYCVAAGPHKGSSHHQCFGKIKDNGRWVVCSIPYLSYIASQTHLTARPLKALKAGGSVIVKTMINHFLPNANTPSTAAKLGWGVYTQSSNPRYRADMPWYRDRLPKGVASGGNGEVAWAKSHHGPWTASPITWQKSNVAVNESNTGHFSLKSAKGKSMKGYKAEVSCPSNTYIESVSLTNAEGVGTIKVHSKDNNAGHKCRYTIGHLPSGTRSQTASPAGHQQVTGAPVYERVGNHGKFGNEHAKGSFTEDCGKSCSTTVPINGKVMAPGGGWNTCAVAKVVETGNTVESVVVKAGTTKAVSFTVPNGDTKHLQWTFRYCHGTKQSTPYSGSKFKINCPPAPQVQVTMNCDCNGVGNIPFTVTKPNSDRPYKMRAYDAGNMVIGKIVLNSGSNDFTLTGAKSGDTITIKVTAAGKTWSFTTTAMSISVS